MSKVKQGFFTGSIAYTAGASRHLIDTVVSVRLVYTGASIRLIYTGATVRLKYTGVSVYD